jgi:hypothetical protein
MKRQFYKQGGVFMGIGKQIALAMGIILLCLLVGGGIGYHVYTHSPQYGLRAIRAAADGHDWEAFSRYIDDKAVAQAAFDDLQAEDLFGTKPDAAEKKLAKEAAQAKQAAIVQAFSEALHQIISQGSVDEAALTQQSRTAIPGVEAGAIMHRAEANHVKLKQTEIRRAGGKAILTLILQDKALSQDLRLELEMQPQADGTWQITRIANLASYFSQIREARQRKLAKLNASIRAEIDQAVTLGEPKLHIGANDEFGFSEKMLIDVPVTYDAKKPLASFAGTITLTDAAGNEARSSFVQPVNKAQKGKGRVQLTHILNPFVRADAHLMKTGMKRTNISITVTQIDYADGAQAVLYTALPAEK